MGQFLPINRKEMEEKVCFCQLTLIFCGEFR